jgi:glycosyltransferase involved in cell wall biosynthesis
MWRPKDNSVPARPITLLINVLSGGGAQRRIATLANRFVALGRSVDLVSLETEGVMRGLLSPDIRIIPVRCAEDLAAYLDRVRPAVLMSCVTDTHGVAVRAGALSGNAVPLVLRASRHPHRSVSRWHIAARIGERIKRAKAARRYARADAIVALSDDGAQALRALPGCRSARIETIPNPVVERTWLDDPASLRPALHNPVPVILGVGRLTRQKDFGTLLRAFALVRAETPCRLELLGEGEERPRLQALARRLGIAHHVAMPGEVDEVADRLARADLLVSSSRWEGMQAVLIEALAAGCPVVATDCPGGARETLQNGLLGRLVPVKAHALMARAMLDQLRQPPAPDMLANGAVRFLQEGKAERYLALFDSLTVSGIGFDWNSPEVIAKRPNII